MFTAREDENRRMLRARDAMDRDWSKPLNVPGLARIAHVSPAHFSRRFRAIFGETPHRYVQRRRMERAAAWLRDSNVSVTSISLAVGYESLGTFSRTFTSIFGVSPSQYRATAHSTPVAVPTCFTARWTRPATTAVSEKRTSVPAPTVEE